MPDSKREAIMKRVATNLAAVPGVTGVFRSEAQAMDRENSPCLLLRWVSEDATPQTVLAMERTLSVEVDVIVRGDVPDALADPIAQAVHASISADPQMGGLAIDTTMGGARFDYTSADETAGKLTQEYLVVFRHSFADMTA
jgi:hypothetical protein